MDSTVRNQAEVLAIGLEIDVLRVDEVVAWADRVIALQDHPHRTICELSLMGRKWEQDVINALRQIPGKVDPDWVGKEVIRMLARLMAEDRSRAQAITVAVSCGPFHSEEDDLDLYGSAIGACDTLTAIEDGFVDATPDQIYDEMLEALQQAAARGSRWPIDRD